MPIASMPRTVCRMRSVCVAASIAADLEQLESLVWKVLSSGLC